ncbi:MAG: phosphate acyltransferase PlsX [Clostridiales bacterium]|nr:phosphate acyltransferase PlsX [Clostridiales bacterium]
MKIVIDAFGGDNSPNAQITGGLNFLAQNNDFSLIFTGDEALIKKELDKYKYDASRVEIVHAPEVISNEESPTAAIKTKKESSMVKAFDIVKNDPDAVAMLSSGSTGAILTGAVLKIGRIEGVLRPTLAPILPTKLKKGVCLVDGGANVDCRPEYLVQFALMGVCYMRAMSEIENPRVGLVSVGTEDKKGNELSKAAFAALKELPINFAGNMEARDALTGEYDLLVADGFAGNVLLKTVEGTAMMVMSRLKAAIMGSTSAKFGSLFMKKAFKQLKRDMDYNAYGGAPFLGIEKIVVKAHGASNTAAIEAALVQIKKMAKGDVVGNIKAEMQKLQELQAANAATADNA